MATEAFERVYPNNSGDDIWVSLAAIEEGKSADEQLAKLWTGLGSRASDERFVRQPGDYHPEIITFTSPVTKLSESWIAYQSIGIHYVVHPVQLPPFSWSILL